MSDWHEALSGDAMTLELVTSITDAAALFTGDQPTEFGNVSVDCGAGVVLVIDALEPSRIVEIQIHDLADPRALTVLRLLTDSHQAVDALAPHTLRCAQRETLQEADPSIELVEAADPTDVAVTVPAGRTASFRAAAAFGLHLRDTALFPFPTDQNFDAINRAVLRGAMARAGLPVEAELTLDVVAMAQALSNLRDHRPDAWLPAIVMDAIELANERGLPTNLWSELEGRVTDEFHLVPSEELRRALGEAQPQAELMFAPDGERRFSVEWQIKEIAELGLSREEGAIVATRQPDSPWVRVVVPCAADFPADVARMWTVVFDAEGRRIAFVPALLDRDERTVRSVLTLPPDVDLNAVDICIRLDPGAAWSSEDRRVGEAARWELRAQLAFRNGDLAESCRYLIRAANCYWLLGDPYDLKAEECRALLGNRMPDGFDVETEIRRLAIGA